MAKILVHVTIGPENPTRAALAFLVAKSAIHEGHSVSMFLAGDAVQLMRKAVLDKEKAPVKTLRCINLFLRSQAMNLLMVGYQTFHMN